MLVQKSQESQAFVENPPAKRQELYPSRAVAAAGGHSAEWVGVCASTVFTR